MEAELERMASAFGVGWDEQTRKLLWDLYYAVLRALHPRDTRRSLESPPDELTLQVVFGLAGLNHSQLMPTANTMKGGRRTVLMTQMEKACVSQPVVAALNALGLPAPDVWGWGEIFIGQVFDCFYDQFGLDLHITREVCTCMYKVARRVARSSACKGTYHPSVIVYNLVRRCMSFSPKYKSASFNKNQIENILKASTGISYRSKIDIPEEMSSNGVIHLGRLLFVESAITLDPVVRAVDNLDPSKPETVSEIDKQVNAIMSSSAKSDIFATQPLECTESSAPDVTVNGWMLKPNLCFFPKPPAA